MVTHPKRRAVVSLRVAVQVLLVEVVPAYGASCVLCFVFQTSYSISSDICLVNVSFDEANPAGAPRTVVRVEPESDCTLIRGGSTGINAE